MGGFECSDEDRAAEQTLIFNDDAVRAVLACLPKGPSATHCQDESCGEEIPEARRKAIQGVQYCIDCAPLHEVKPNRIRMINYD